MSRTMNHSLSDRAAPTSQEFITQIYKKYDRRMLFTAKKYLMDLQECEDAVQESLLKLMRRIELLRTLEEPILTSYVVTTVRNTAINILRRQKRDAQNITSFTESVEESIIEPDSIIDIIMDREAKRSLREAIDELEPNERLLLEGKYFLGYCQTEYMTPGNIERINKLLKCAFGQAIRWDIVSKNPFENTTLPKVKRRTREIWDAATIRKALDECTDARLYAAINLSFSCSLRIGEIGGLTWDNVHISDADIAGDDAHLIIDKQLERVSEKALEAVGEGEVILKFP